MNPDLINEVVNQQRAGWRLDGYTPSSANMSKGEPTSHTTHLILSIFTAGLWVPVWIACAIFFGKKERTIWLDKRGNLRIK